MARPWRIQYPDAVYHITARGNNGKAIFLNDADRLDFLALLGKAAERFNLNIFAFCLMTNHYHLFLQTQEANLSPAMHWLNATYSIHCLHRHKQYGHFLQGRYKAVLVLEDEHWRKLSFYIHLNPVRARIVDHPGKYPWSSFQDYVSRKSRFDWLCREAVLDEYRGAKFMARALYKKECLAMAGAELKAWKDIRDRVVIGSREALAKIAAKYKPKDDRYVPDYKKSSRPGIDIEDEIKKVADAFKVKADDLKQRKRNFPAKLALYFHLVENCGLSASEVAKYLGLSPMAVSIGVRRLNDKTFDNPKLGKTLKSVKFKVET